MLLIAIDGSYEGFFTDARWVGIHEFWIRDVLDLPKFLECERRHTYKEFKEVREKYNIQRGHGKITLSRGHLITDIDLNEVKHLHGRQIFRLNFRKINFTEKRYLKIILQE